VSESLRGAVALLREAKFDRPGGRCRGTARPRLGHRLTRLWAADDSSTSQCAGRGHHCVRRVSVQPARQRVPLQHLTGVAHFRHLELQVGPGVFVPRPETELLVGAALAELSDRDSDPSARSSSTCAPDRGRSPWHWPANTTESTSSASNANPRRWNGHRRIWDGSASAIPLSNSSQRMPRRSRETSSRSCIARADVVVTNPPYVPDAAIPRDPEVADHDPAVALYGGTHRTRDPGSHHRREPRRCCDPADCSSWSTARSRGPESRELLDASASLRQPATSPGLHWTRPLYGRSPH
jgi:release factor glutamine methyltransferase